MRHVATHGHNGYFGCDREGCPNLPAVYGMRTRCRCEGWQTQNNGKCAACDSPVLADWEWELLTDGNSGGFVETDQEDIYPVTVMVYLGTHGKENAGEYVKISNVKESSISIENRKGVQTLVCESFVTNRIAYVPNAVWYMTECQTEVQPY